MDDRFDRRELLLHLGDVLEATDYVARASRPYAPVAQLATDEASLQAFPFLRYVAPRVRATDFPERVASAYAHWPKALLETQLNRTALAAAVRRELFDDNPEGWAAYSAYMREKVSWFGLDPSERTTTAAMAQALSTPVTRERVTGAPRDRTGWPWTPIKSATYRPSRSDNANGRAPGKHESRGAPLQPFLPATSGPLAGRRG